MGFLLARHLKLLSQNMEPIQGNMVHVSNGDK